MVKKNGQTLCKECHKKLHIILNSLSNVLRDSPTLQVIGDNRKRKKFGKKRFQAMAVAGKKRKK